MKKVDLNSPSSPKPNFSAAMSLPKLAKSLSSRIECKGFPIISKIIYSQGKLVHSHIARSPVKRRDLKSFKKYSHLFKDCLKEFEEQEAKELQDFFLQKRKLQFRFAEEGMQDVEDKVNLLRAKMSQGNMKKVKCERKASVTRICFRSRRGASSFQVYDEHKKFLQMTDDLRKKIQPHSMDDDHDTDSEQCAKGVQTAYLNLIQAVRSSSMRTTVVARAQLATRSRSVFGFKRGEIFFRLSESLIN